MDTSLSTPKTTDVSSSGSLHEFFERKPDFGLLLEFFDGPTLEVLAAYCKQVFAHSKKVFELQRDTRPAEAMFPTLREFLLIAPAHCGYKQCTGVAICNIKEPDWEAAAINLVKKLKYAHGWARIAYPEVVE